MIPALHSPTPGDITETCFSNITAFGIRVRGTIYRSAVGEPSVIVRLVWSVVSSVLEALEGCVRVLVLFQSREGNGVVVLRAFVDGRHVVDIC